MKKVFALLLALAMVVLTFSLIGCGETPVESIESQTSATAGTEKTTASGETTASADGTTAASGNSSASSGTVATTATTGGTATPSSSDDLDGYAKHPDYMDVNFGGKTFNFIGSYGWDGGWDCYEIYQEATGNDNLLSESIIKRNQTIENLYNCKIHYDQASDSKGAASFITDDISLGKCTYQFYMALWSNHGSPASALNLYNLDIDFTHDWWDSKYIDCFTNTINGKNDLRAISGDFNLITLDSIICIFVNMGLYEQLRATGTISMDIFDEVRKGTWTIDKLIEVVGAAKKDTDGNQVMEYYTGDVFGFACDKNILFPDCFYQGMGGRYSVKNDQGQSESISSENSDITHYGEIIEKILALQASEGFVNPGGTEDERMIMQTIAKGYALFIPQYVLRLHSTNKYENYGTDLSAVRLSVVPFPKYDENQEQYYCKVCNRCYGLRVSPMNTDLSEISDFIEIWGFHGKAILYPGYIKYIKTQCLCNEEAGEMLSIILDSRTYDFEIFGTPIHSSTVYQAVTLNKGTGFFTRGVTAKVAVANTIYDTIRDEAGKLTY